MHKTYLDKNLTAIDAKPDFVIIFMGPAVKLISTGKEGVSAEDGKSLDAMRAMRLS